MSDNGIFGKHSKVLDVKDCIDWPAAIYSGSSSEGMGSCVNVRYFHSVSENLVGSHAVIFDGGKHDITGLTIGGQILVKNGALVFGEGVTIDMRLGHRVTIDEYKDLIPRVSFLKRLFRKRHPDECLLKETPYIVRGKSTLKIPGVKVLTSTKSSEMYMAGAYEGSTLDCRNANYTTADGDDPDVQRWFRIAVAKTHE